MFNKSWAMVLLLGMLPLYGFADPADGDGVGGAGNGTGDTGPTHVKYGCGDKPCPPVDGMQPLREKFFDPRSKPLDISTLPKGELLYVNDSPASILGVNGPAGKGTSLYINTKTPIATGTVAWFPLESGGRKTARELLVESRAGSRVYTEVRDREGNLIEFRLEGTVIGGKYDPFITRTAVYTFRVFGNMLIQRGELTETIRGENGAEICKPRLDLDYRWIDLTTPTCIDGCKD